MKLWPKPRAVIVPGLLLPLAGGAILAQVTPAVSESEQALRTRAEQFFRLQVEKKYRQSESLVAEESRDIYYDSNKPRLEDFHIIKVDFTDKGSKAKVTILAKSTVMIMGAGPQKFEMPSVSNWVLRDGKWMLYLNPESIVHTPFGDAKTAGGAADAPAAGPDMKGKAPGLDELQKAVSVDAESVVLEPGGPEKLVTVTNGLPGQVQIKLQERATPIAGLIAKLDKDTLQAGGKATVTLRAEKGAKFSDSVYLEATPLGQKLVIRVSTK